MKIKPLLCLVLILLSTILISSCNFNASYLNDEQDKEDAEHTTLQLYALLENKEYNKTHPFFSQKFFSVTDTSQLNQIFRTSDEKLGKIKNKELLKWETNTIKGSNPKSEYLMIYNVVREKFNSTETIRLEKENDKIQILAYNVQSKGFEIQ